MQFRDIPYVTDREAFAIARSLQPSYPGIARRIRRSVWRRRIVNGGAMLLAVAGFWAVLVAIARYALTTKGVW